MANSGPKRVTLVDPDGNEFRASTPADISSLVYGSGYKIKDKGLTVEEAKVLLAEEGPAAEFLEPPAAPVPVPAPPKGADKGGDK